MFNLREIMIRAWRLYRENEEISFSEALHRSWLSAKAVPVNAARIAAAKAEAGITEEVNTWAGWQKLGRMVAHGSKSIFVVDLLWGSKGDNAIYRARFFSFGQTEAVEA